MGVSDTAIELIISNDPSLNKEQVTSNTESNIKFSAWYLNHLFNKYSNSKDREDINNWFNIVKDIFRCK